MFISSSDARPRDPVGTPATPRVGPDRHPYFIQDFFTMRETLFVRGIVEHSPDETPTMLLRDGDGAVYEVQRREDPFQLSSPGRTCFHIAHGLARPITGEQLRNYSLYVLFSTGHLLIDRPGEQQIDRDRFAQSEAIFWEAVKAHPGGKVLEIGSRARSGIARRDLFPGASAYVGFDISPGPNVDVVGDAHALSAHFPKETFDFAFSVSVWEHLAMPWKVSLELNRVLRTGGIVMVNTHQSWPSHEEPWDYFRFSEYSWASLFNAATGFEIMACGHGAPAVMAPAVPLPHLVDQKMDWQYGFLASRVVARKISETKLEWPVETSLVSQGIYSH